jgi:hypothetical protein
MRIHFARREQKSRKMLLAFWAALLVGGIAAISSPDGFGIAQIGLAGAFVLLAAYASASISDDYGEQAFATREVSGDEYTALNTRLQMYPDLKGPVKELIGEDSKVTYREAYQIEDVINSHALGALAQQDEAARQESRDTLYKNLGRA